MTEEEIERSARLHAAFGMAISALDMIQAGGKPPRRLAEAALRMIEQSYPELLGLRPDRGTTKQ
jgi:hypothetical protein